MPASGPVPDVAPQDPIQLVKCFLRTGVPVKISPSGDDRVQVTDQYCCLRTPVFNNNSLQLVNHRPDTYFCRPDLAGQCLQAFVLYCFTL